MPGVESARSQIPELWIDRVVDFVVGVFSLAAAVVLHLEMSATEELSGVTPGLAVAAVHGGAVLLRRRRPRAVLVLLMTTAVAYVLLGFPAFMLGPAVVFTVYSAGSELERNSSLSALVAVEISIAVLLILGPTFPGLPAVAFYLAIVGAAWWLGYLLRRWRTAAAMHARRADELAASREELARYAVAEERRRIARELHDVIAHSMTVVAMHAGTGRLVAAEDPASALPLLGMIERLSREAVSEMRRLVGLLRGDADDGEGLAPTPGLTELHRLIAEMVAAGMAVEVQIEGGLEEVPPGPALAAFRIIQEALTNAAKHAASSKVSLFVAVGESELTIEIENDATAGSSAGGPDSTPGMGMVGMRERAQVYNGSLTAGLVDGGRFRIAARIPLGLGAS